MSLHGNGNGGDVLGKLVEPEKTSSWAGKPEAPSTPHSLIGNAARTRANRWIDAASAVGILYKFRIFPPPPGPQPPPTPLWPIAGVGIAWSVGAAPLDDGGEKDVLEEVIVVYMLKEFPIPEYLKIAEWDDYRVRYEMAGSR